jgi:hypothetical protein
LRRAGPRCGSRRSGSSRDLVGMAQGGRVDAVWWALHGGADARVVVSFSGCGRVCRLGPIWV